MEADGNFVDEASGQRSGANVLFRALDVAALADEFSLPENDVETRLEDARARLLARRAERERPLRDDKVLTDLNGLAIASLARAARVLDEPRYAEAATAAAHFVQTHLRRDDGRLLHRYRDGEAGLPGYLDDHAFLIWGLVELYEATFDPAMLEHALALQDVQDAHFWDEADGGYFLSADDGEPLLVRRKVVYDGAIPSGNSVSALNLLRLSRLTGNPKHEQRAEQLMRAFSAQVAAQPSAHTFLLLALDFALGPAHEVVIAGERGAADTRRLLDVLRETYLPNAVLLLRDEATSEALDRITGYTESHTPRGGATAYVCRQQRCEAPVTSAEALRERLEG